MDKFTIFLKNFILSFMAITALVMVVLFFTYLGETNPLMALVVLVVGLSTYAALLKTHYDE